MTSKPAFRFTFIYVGLYVLFTQMLQGLLAIPKLPVPEFGKLPPMRPLVMWVGHRILGVEPILKPTGSGDTMYDWTQAFTMLLLALLGTIVWTLRSRPDADYERLHKWFRLFLRFALGTTMLSYGFAKLWPMQMPVLFLDRLVEPFGDFSPMGVIWYSIGASPWYERFIGFSEVLGGTLLFLPRTALLGAVVSFGLTTGVWVINMTYDVPVKLFAFHLVIFCLILIAPDARRLFDLFIANRTVAPAPVPRYGNSVRSDRNWRLAQGVMAVWLLGYSTYGSTEAWVTFGGGAPKSPLFGIWDVESMSINGELRPPLVTDTTRYQYMVFQRPSSIGLWHMDRTPERIPATVDTIRKAIDLKTGANGVVGDTLAYQRPTPDELVLDGTIRRKPVHMVLKRHDLNRFLLNSRGFNWVQELPFNK